VFGLFSICQDVVGEKFHHRDINAGKSVSVLLLYDTRTMRCVVLLDWLRPCSQRAHIQMPLLTSDTIRAAMSSVVN